MTTYRGMDRAALDAAYNNQAAVEDFHALVDAWRVRTSALRKSPGAMVDLAYGPAARHRLDYFPHPDACGGPLLVFIHGGYWQGGDKGSAGFVAEGPTQRGFAVAVVEYTVAPQARLQQMLDEMRMCLRWLRDQADALGFDRDHIVLAGHSAGAQLLCSALEQPGVVGGIAISGLYDLEPIRLCYLNDKLGLTSEDVRLLSPMLHLPVNVESLLVTVGSAELPELVRQSEQFAMAAGARYLPLDGRNHFSVLEELADPNGAICRRLPPFAASSEGGRP